MRRDLRKLPPGGGGGGVGSSGGGGDGSARIVRGSAKSGESGKDVDGMELAKKRKGGRIENEYEISKILSKPEIELRHELNFDATVYQDAEKDKQVCPNYAT